MARVVIRGAATKASAVIGSAALGIVLGMFLGRLLLSLGTFDVADLATLVGIVAAGAVVNFISSMDGGPEALASYSVGLLFGVAVYVIGVNGGWIPPIPATATPSPST